MKTLDEFIKEIKGSKDLQKELKKVNDIDAADAFLKKHGCSAAADELAEYIRSQNKDGVRELSDDEASAASGGTWYNFGEGWFNTDDEVTEKKTTHKPLFQKPGIENLPNNRSK